jgi:pyruvate dehydrogenase E2 component (dihydrolipoamide acetyltransferase)
MTKKDYLSIVPASPKARKFARELGIDINKVLGSERQGRVTEKDIKLFISTKSHENIKKEEKIKQEYSHSEFGEVEVKDIPRIKRLSSKYLINSWTNIPHVTNHDEADITELEQFRDSLKDTYTGEKKKNYSFSFYY